MEELFKNHIRSKKLLDESKTYLLAISGGIDSVCLGYLLRSAKISFALAHVNFGLRGDESNQDDKYDRNFLRLEIIPRLKARWPSIATTASRSAALCAEQQATLDLQVSERLPLWLTQAPYHTQSVFKLDGFAEQSVDWQALLLRGFIESQGFALPSKVQLKQIITQLLNAKDDAKVHIRVGECEIRRFANQVYLFKYQTHKRHTQPVSWTLPQHDFISLLQGDSTELVVSPAGLANGEQIRLIVTKQGPRVRLPWPDEVVSVRYQLAGQFRCHPHSRGKGRELKKLWQEFGVPPWVREKVGFVFYRDEGDAEKMFVVDPLPVADEMRGPRHSVPRDADRTCPGQDQSGAAPAAAAARWLS